LRTPYTRTNFLTRAASRRTTYDHLAYRERLAGVLMFPKTVLQFAEQENKKGKLVREKDELVKGLSTPSLERRQA